ncbi:MAG: 4Fe-4S dicluster domain-containing protein [bacterium]|jgi:2-oxoglutarate ferredoxin oxidoreductase subunit delta
MGHNMAQDTKTFAGFRSQVPKGGSWTVYPGLCKGCGLCIEVCPVNVIGWSDRLCVYGTPSVEVDAAGCILCHQCERICPDAAIGVESYQNKIAVQEQKEGEKDRQNKEN